MITSKYLTGSLPVDFVNTYAIIMHIYEVSTPFANIFSHIFIVFMQMFGFFMHFALFQALFP